MNAVQFRAARAIHTRAKLRLRLAQLRSTPGRDNTIDTKEVLSQAAQDYSRAFKLMTQLLDSSGDGWPYAADATRELRQMRGGMQAVFNDAPSLKAKYGPPPEEGKPRKRRAVGAVAAPVRFKVRRL